METIDVNDFSIDSVMAVAIPFIASLVNQYNWPSQYKALLALGLCVIAGLIQAAVSNKLDAAHIVSSIVYVAILSEIIYQKFKTQFKALEAYTTPGIAVNYSPAEPESLVTNPPAVTPVPASTVTEPVEAVDIPAESGK